MNATIEKMKQHRTEFVIDNSVDQKPLIEVVIEYTNGCTTIYDAFSDCIIGEWCAPEVAQRVWENPHAFI